MKGPVLSAWIAAGLVLAASGARAQQADCDLICRLQGYLSTDHMAAAGGAASSSTAAPVKHRSHAAATAPKVAAKPEPAVDAKAPAKRPVKAAAEAPAKNLAAVERATVPEPDLPEAAAIAKPKPVKAAKTVAMAPRPTNLDPESSKPSKHHVVAALATASDPSSGPPSVTTSPRPRRNAPATSRSAHKQASRPVASADLIPGSARLVPAEFQTFGDL